MPGIRIDPGAATSATAGPEISAKIAMYLVDLVRGDGAARAAAAGGATHRTGASILAGAIMNASGISRRLIAPPPPRTRRYSAA